MSFAEVAGAEACDLAVSLDPVNLPVFAAAVADAGGTAFGALPLPNNPSLAGLALFAQWAVIDPQGIYNQLPVALAVTPLRRIVLE